MSEQEQRGDARAPIELMVVYQRADAFFTDYTANISRGGTFIRTDQPLPVGTKCCFLMKIPGRDQPFELNGEVAWLNDDRVQGNPAVAEKGMGIRFIFASESARISFKEEVERLMQSGAQHRAVD